MNNLSSSLSTQRGAILIIVLVMLVLLTLIGTAGMRTTSLQENMASNLREDTLSFEAAEAALRSGENDVSSRYLNNTLNNLEANSITGTINSITNTAEQPSFEIHLVAQIKTSTEAGIPIDDEGMLVRVEANGSGIARDSNAAAISRTTLQSTFLVEK